jgi:hypothetical protein
VLHRFRGQRQLRRTRLRLTGQPHASQRTCAAAVGARQLTCRRDHEFSDLLGRGHAGDDLVDVVDLLLASLGEDVLARGVFRPGRLGAFHDALVEVVIRMAGLRSM